jgi:hypothetical protein
VLAQQILATLNNKASFVNLNTLDQRELAASNIMLLLTHIEYHSLNALCYHFLDLYAEKKNFLAHLANARS